MRKALALFLALVLIGAGCICYAHVSVAADRDKVTFEENIMYPVALYSEMLWDCSTDIKTMMSEVALRNYVTFA